MKNYILVIISAFLLSCMNDDNLNFIIIGSVKNLPTKMIYIANTDNIFLYLDSAIYQNGKFNFKIKREGKTRFPFMSVLYYKDTLKNNAMTSIMLLNSYKGGNGKKSFRDLFMTEEKPILIYQNKENDIVLKGSKQNELLKISNIYSFGLLPKDVKTRKTYLTKYKSLVEKYPTSFLLFTLLLYAKENYTNQELSILLQQFDETVLHSDQGKIMSNYLKHKTQKGQRFPSVDFLTTEGAMKKISYEEKKINVLVFWASWCGPCRMEIPQIKQTVSALKGKSIGFYSISVDENKAQWLKAVKDEEMEWEQLLVLKSNIQDVKAIFNFSSIPQIVITDEKGIEIYRALGYNKDFDYVSFINGKLSLNNAKD